MRIPLAHSARQIQQQAKQEGARQVMESWRTWVSSKCPRLPVEPPDHNLRLLGDRRAFPKPPKD